MKSTKTPKVAAPQPPVSEAANLELTIFAQPQGNMRGTLIAFDTVKGIYTVRAHGYIWSDADVEITLKAVRGKLTTAEVTRLTEILALFTAKANELNAQR